MFYHSVDSIGDTIATFTNRDAALDAFFGGTVANVFNTYKPGYHRELTACVAYYADGQWVTRRPTRAECIDNDVI